MQQTELASSALPIDDCPAMMPKLKQGQKTRQSTSSDTKSKQSRENTASQQHEHDDSMQTQ
jgi:hypothetical protein